MEKRNKIIISGVVGLTLIGMIFGEDTKKESKAKTINDKKNTVEKTQVNKYAEDDIVNQFVTDFKTTSNYELTNIKKGNIKTKYFVYINNQYCELLNATNQANYFSIIIHGGNHTDDVDKIVNVYKDIIKTLDKSITENQINETISTYIKSDTNTRAFTIGEKISVSFYPIKSLSYGDTNCRIEITTTKYNDK